jgi:hypothetical protein
MLFRHSLMHNVSAVPEHVSYIRLSEYKEQHNDIE